MSNIYSSLENLQASVKRRWIDYSQRITASLEIKKQRGHLLVLDGVRAAACLAVLLQHIIYQVVLITGLWKPAGKIQVLLASALNFGASAVILFFLLSGFLLFLPFAKTLLFDGQWPSVSRFYLRRFFRIIPGYYVALFLIILFFHSTFLGSAHRVHLLKYLTFTMSSDLSQQLNAPFLTLAIAFHLYMLLPLLALLFCLIARRGSLRWRMTKLTGCLLLMIGWGLLSRYWGLSIANTSTLDFLI